MSERTGQRSSERGDGAGVEPGPLAEEAARLVEAALGWARQVAGAVVGPPGATGQAGAECASCPVCRLLRAVRDDRPELAGRLTATVTDLGSGVAGLLGVLAEARAATPGSAAGRAADRAADRASGRATDASTGREAPEADPVRHPRSPDTPRHVVERIDLT